MLRKGVGAEEAQIAHASVNAASSSKVRADDWGAEIFKTKCGTRQALPAGILMIFGNNDYYLLSITYC